MSKSESVCRGEGVDTDEIYISAPSLAASNSQTLTLNYFCGGLRLQGEPRYRKKFARVRRKLRKKEIVGKEEVDGVLITWPYLLFWYR